MYYAQGQSVYDYLIPITIIKQQHYPDLSYSRAEATLSQKSKDEEKYHALSDLWSGRMEHWNYFKLYLTIKDVLWGQTRGCTLSHSLSLSHFLSQEIIMDGPIFSTSILECPATTL